MVTCLVDTFFPETGHAVARVLERAGCHLTCPARQTCCGQPAFNGGFTDEARAMAAHTVDTFSADDAPVVVPSGSCAEMIVHHYPALLAGRPAYASRAQALAGRTFELTQYLVEVVGGRLGRPTFGRRVAYHASCHGYRGLGIRRQPEQLLRNVAGLTLVPLADADVCCGFGGLFSVKMPAVSEAMLDRKLASIEASGADFVAVTDVSCAMHLMGALRRRRSRAVVGHIAHVLAGEPDAGA